ncbi:MAG: hypothetical protein WAU99_14625 [Pseudolabrys sp.]
MWTASIVTQSDEHPSTLGGALGSTAIESLKIAPHALERVALLINLPVESTTLPWWIAEDREEAGVFAAHAAGLRNKPIDFELLAVDRFFCTANLLGARWISVAPIETCQLGFKPLAGGIG